MDAYFSGAQFEVPLKNLKGSPMGGSLALVERSQPMGEWIVALMKVIRTYKWAIFNS